LLSSNHLSIPVSVIEAAGVPVVLVHEIGFNIAQKIKLSIRALVRWAGVFSRGAGGKESEKLPPAGREKQRKNPGTAALFFGPPASQFSASFGVFFRHDLFEF